MEEITMVCRMHKSLNGTEKLSRQYQLLIELEVLVRCSAFQDLI